MEAQEMYVETRSVGSFGGETPRAQQSGTYNPSRAFSPAENLMQIPAYEMRGQLTPLRGAGALLRRVASDPDRVTQAAEILDRNDHVESLVTNAAKYTNRGGTIGMCVLVASMARNSSTQI